LALGLCAGIALESQAAVQGEYFSWTTTVPPGNPILPSTTTIHRATRTDANINFNWGADPGVTNIGADNFAVRWRARINIPTTGNWTFHVSSDDGIRLFIDQVYRTGQWVDRGTTTDSVTINGLTAGFHDVTVEYYENGGGATATFEWEGPGVGRQVVPAGSLVLPVENGLTARYVNNSADPLATPTITRYDHRVQADWGTNSPDNAIGAENFVARWQGKVEAAGTGSYVFTMRTDDGCELWINGTRVINSINSPNAPTDFPGTPINLVAGRRYTIDARFREQTGGAYCDLRWSGPGTGGDVIIPEQNLFAAINVAATDIVPSDTNVDENAGANAIVCTLGSTDTDNPADAPAHTYSLVTGTGDTNNGLFNINGNQLRANGSFNFEAQSSYSVRIRSTDISSVDPSPTYEEAITITVNNLNETPTALNLSNTNINENTGANAVVGNLSTVDPDTGQSYTYTLVAGAGSTDNGFFNISGNQLRFTASPNFEAQASYAVRLRTTDNGANPANLFTEQQFTITLNNLNEAPTVLNLTGSTIDENSAADSTIGTLSTVDPDNPGAGQTHTYTLVAGTGDTDNGAFNIAGNALRLTGVSNFEAQASYSVRVLTTDNGANPANLSLAQQFTINVNNLNEAPTDITLSNDTLDENAGSNALVGSFSTTDPDNPGAGQTHAYTLVAGAGDDDNAAFAIVGNQLQALASLDFETQSSYSVRVRTTDSGATPPSLTREEFFVITLNNINEQPSALNLSSTVVDENAGANAVVGVLSTVDPDNPGAGQTFTYTLIAGAGDEDNGLVNILGNQLRITASPDFESQASYNVRVRTTDSGTSPANLTRDAAFVLTVNNLNEAPSALNLSNTAIDENTGANAVVGTLSTVDPDNPSGAQTFTYTLAAGAGDTDNGLVNIAGDQLRITASPNFESKSSYAVRVRTTDNGANPANLTREAAFVLSINNLNEAPTAIQLSSTAILPTTGGNVTIATLSTDDPDNPAASQTHTYTLVAGAGDTDNGDFVIVGDALRTAPGFVANSQPDYDIRVRSVDSGTPTLDREDTFTIVVSNDVVPPVITLVGDALVEVDCGEGYTEEGATASDDVDGDISANLVVTGDLVYPVNTPPGDYLVVYNVEDSSTNAAATVTRTVRVRDNCPLFVEILGDNPVIVEEGADYTFTTSAVTGNIGAVSYQWQLDDAAKAFNDLAGENGPALALTAISAADAGDYRVLVSDDVTEFASQAVSLQFESGLPLAGLAGLSAVALALAGAGARATRRKRG
jgi:hypothetical protein